MGPNGSGRKCLVHPSHRPQIQKSSLLSPWRVGDELPPWWEALQSSLNSVAVSGVWSLQTQQMVCSYPPVFGDAEETLNDE